MQAFKIFFFSISLKSKGTTERLANPSTDHFMEAAGKAFGLGGNKHRRGSRVGYVDVKDCLSFLGLE